MEPVICVMGEPQAGKDTAAAYLSELTGLKVGTCSTVIYDILAKLDDLPPGDWHEVTPPSAIERTRLRLIDLGNAISDECPAVYPEALIRRGCSIIVGVRRAVELRALEEYCEKYGKWLIKIWIARPDRPDIKDNNEMCAGDANWVISSSSIEEMKDKLKSLAKALVLHKTKKQQS